MMTTPTLRQKILIAIASGCTNTRQVAKRLNVPHSSVTNYFYSSRYLYLQLFTNGDVLKWEPNKSNTLRLGPNAAVIRNGQRVLAVGRAEKVERRP